LILPDELRNYRLLLRRWTRLVKGIPWLELRVFCVAGSYPLCVVESRERLTDAPSVYFSAGIHGDEPAPVEGLLRWATKGLASGGNWNWQIFPCLNPWGLERNSRTDEKGRDLNRHYNTRTVPQIEAQRSLMKGWRYDLAVTLHEDYDARGFYLYEIAGSRPYWGEGLRDAMTGALGYDTRSRIDGHAVRRGVIRRPVKPGMMKGYPEALFLHFKHARRTFTFETPSEGSLEQRVRLQSKFLTASLKNLKLAVAYGIKKD